MYPNTFDYLTASTVDEAVAALAEDPDETRVLAGGQSLIPMMKLRLAYPERLVDINGIPGLSHIERRNGHLSIGALARHADIEASDATFGALRSAAPWIADPLVRNRGTLCGSVAHCDPEGDWNSVLLATGAEVIAAGPDGERTIDITDFVVGLFENALEPGEMVTEVRVPVPRGRSGGRYLKLERKIGDYATVGVAIQLELGDDGMITRAGIGLTNAGPHNLKATEAEAALVGNQAGEELFADVASMVADASDPQTDVRGTAAWKRHVIAVYTRRGLTQSLADAQGA